MDNYMVISCDANGLSMEEMNKEKLLKEIGNHKVINSEIPEIDGFCFHGILIIKGKIVTPKPVTRVTEYGIE